MGGKRKVMKAKLDEFLEYIHASEVKMTQEQYLEMVREKVKQYTKQDVKQVQTNYILEKICEICNDFHHDEQLLLCDYCDDAYHTFCLTPALKDIPDEDEDWFCPICVEQKYQVEKEKKRQSQSRSSNSKVQKLLESFQFKDKRVIAQKVQSCGKCEDMILYMENEGVIEESDKCIKCNKLFHKHCFSKKKDSILCTSCSNLIAKQIPQTQKMIDEYFIKDQMMSQNQQSNKKITNNNKNDSMNNIKSTQQNNKLKQNIIIDDDEILDVDALKEQENMRTTRGSRKNKSIESIKNNNKDEIKQKNNKRSQSKKKVQDDDSEDDDQNQINEINDIYINNSYNKYDPKNKNNNKNNNNKLAKKLKRNDKTAFITNNNNIQSSQSISDDSNTLPLQKQMSNNSQYNDDSESTTASTITNTITQNKQNKSQPITNYKGVKFLLPQPSSNPIINLQCKQSLIYALKAKNIQFCDDLSYTQSCRREDNNAENEPNLQVIDITNAIIFSKFKEMTRQGIYAPVMVEEDKIQGFIVRAQEDIKAKTLITEYVGEVDFARNHIFNKNDSIMDLLRTARSKTSLVILPDKKGNLARFLSGINNSSKKSMAKQNVHSVRFNINGESHVILYAKKNIKKGELLYYDYNAGGFGEYPTQDFV